MDLMWVLGAALVVAFVVLIVMVAVSTRRNTALHAPTPRAVVEPERDPWEEALLASTPDPLTPRPAPTVLDRDALAHRPRDEGDFDPSGWDDRPDGYEGTDFGLVGGKDS